MKTNEEPEASVVSVSYNIIEKDEFHDGNEETKIEDALSRNSFIKSQNIKFSIAGTKVTLYGKASSNYQKDEADRIAWNTQGVWPVDNRIEVEYE